jgi:hypothetical protein
MTEDDWLACTDPIPMLDHFKAAGFDNARKRRLFTVACCRRISPLFSDRRIHHLLEVSEGYTEGLTTEDDLAVAWLAVHSLHTAEGKHSLPPYSFSYWAENAALNAARPERLGTIGHKSSANAASHALGLALSSGDINSSTYKEASDAEDSEQSKLLRCVFGNPFRLAPPRLASVLSWKDRIIPRIAQGIYFERAFERMPILHDALLDAGCTDDALLTHCRNPEGHVLGCWAIDLILGKE